jgi:hypothetical protein
MNPIQHNTEDGQNQQPADQENSTGRYMDADEKMPSTDASPPAEQPETNNPKPVTDNMEVHHHTHHPKKWKEYFWEFFMLFLAVFCGFLAEIQVEHYVEHQREQQYVKTLIEDLDVDSVRLKGAIGRAELMLAKSDSVLLMYVKKDFLKPALKKSFAIVSHIAGYSIDIAFSDRTSSQLKGSGSLRLIRNKEVTDSILLYWNAQDRTQLTRDRYESFRLESRKIGWKVFDWYPWNYAQSSVLNDITGLSEQTGIYDTTLLHEYINAISASYATVKTQYLLYLKGIFRQNRNLSHLIKKEYKM